MAIRVEHAVQRTFKGKETLNVGVENELIGYQMVLTQPTAGGALGERELVKIRYSQTAVMGTQIAEVAHLKTKIPLNKIVVEGTTKANPHLATPEHVGGPVQTGSAMHDIAQQSLKLLLDSFRETIGETAARIQIGTDTYFRLSYAIDKYNLKVVRKSNESPANKKTWAKFKLKCGDSGANVWAIRAKPAGRSIDATGTQVNIEIPFTSIWRPIPAADLASKFGANTEIFVDCRDLAGRLVQDTFQVSRLMQKRIVISDFNQIQMNKLKSYFTLYYYSKVVIHMASSTSEHMKNEEALATKCKSAFVLLPKVTLQELHDRALSDHDRELLREVMGSPIQWMTMKTRMTADLRRIDADRLGRARIDYKQPLNVVDTDHDKMLCAFGMALSATGKPLPVRILKTDKVVTDILLKSGYKQVEKVTKTTSTEAVVVFEVRMSGDKLQNAGKASDGIQSDAMRNAIEEIKKLQALS